MTTPPIEEFIEAIRTELKNGFSFTPFVGAGVSAASGMMMGREFNSYLIYAVYRCVAPDSSQQLGSRWDLKRDGWLRKPNGDQYRNAQNWLRERYNELKDKIGDEALPPFFPLIFSSAGKGEQDELSLKTLQRFGGEKAAWNAQVEAACRRWEQRSEEDDERAKKTQSLRSTWENAGIPHEEHAITEKALRSLYDWKAILAFLSHLKPGGFLKFAKEPDDLIVDRFNIHITWGQKPNLAHNQLVHLARPLRIRQIFTTNFDTLIEQAFAEVDLPLRVIETTTGGALPDPALVMGTNCLVKMHGGAQQTRADFSLNEVATERDKRRFSQYLYHERGIGKNKNCLHNPSHLLVLGFSGSDWRVIDLIQHALWKNPELKVFCIANSKRSEKTFVKNFEGWEDRVKVFTLGRADLVLLRLYQELTHSLPPGGFSSRFGQPVPAGDEITLEKKILSQLQIEYLSEAKSSPNFEFRHLNLDDKFVRSYLNKNWEGQADQFKDWYTRLTGNELNDSEEESEKERNRIVDTIIENLGTHLKEWRTQTLPSYAKTEEGGWVVSAVGQTGLLSYFQALFNIHEGWRNQTMWIELEDYASPADIIAEILRNFALSRGKYQTTHVDLDRHPEVEESGELTIWIKDVLDFLDLSPSDCVIFLYGRNGPGGCSHLTAHYWDEKDYESLEKLLSVLSELGMRIYYLPYSKFRWARNSEKEGSEGITKRLELIQKETSPSSEKTAFKDEFWPEKAPKAASGFVQRLPISVVHDEFGWIPNSEDVSDHEDDRSSTRFNNLIDQIGSQFLLCRPGDDQTRDEENPVVWKEIGEVCSGAQFSSAVEGGVEGDSLWGRLQFLYACTLFRQSRHPSALISEGVYPCPAAFVGECHDNDLIRARTVELWLKTLREIGLFLDKPGGYLWQYRDTRLGLQSLLESFSDIQTSESGHLDFLGQRRARLHFWISEWYRDAFYSTRHIIPLVESVYHRCAAVRFAKWAKPSHLKLGDDATEILRYRFHIVIACLIEIEDIFVAGGEAAAFWKPGDQGRRIFCKESLLESIGVNKMEVESLPFRKDLKKLDREFIEWAEAVLGLQELKLEEQTVTDTLGDYSRVLHRLVSQVIVASDILSGQLNMEIAAGFSAVLSPSVAVRSTSSFESSGTKFLKRDFCFDGARKETLEELKSVLVSIFGENIPRWIANTGDVALKKKPDERETQVAKARGQLAPSIVDEPAKGYLALQALAEIAYVRVKSNKLDLRAGNTETSKRLNAEEKRSWVA
ncbi:MAG: SIR2 family protein, partial [Verrucomicrobiales bacterium]|nr:SIR2 family protein [Verrucomicrobiales bacterium]